MTFVFFKFAWALLRPGTVIALVLVVGALIWSLGGGRWRRFGQTLTVCGIVVLGSFLFLPLGSLITQPLEDRIKADPLPGTIAGIVILGGSIHPPLSDTHSQPVVNEAAERLTHGLVLARRYPKARVIFTGGSASVFGPRRTEAEAAEVLFRDLGFAGERFIFEDRSRNTFENAVYSKELARPQEGEAWVLVTSASHMPRSLGVFSAVDWDMIAYPVDYRSGGFSDPLGDMNLAEELALFEYGLREWLGLAAYRLRGWTGSFWPDRG